MTENRGKGNSAKEKEEQSVPKSILANPTDFSGRLPEFWTCYRATGNFVISSGILVSQALVYKNWILVGARPETSGKMKASSSSFMAASSSR